MSEKMHTVLLVDDEVNILNSLKRLLRREHYHLLTAGSGTEGLKILKENDVHLVLTDQRMPGMSGIEFLAKVKKQYPDVIRIMLTGYTDVDSITESINEGHIYKFFLKPWNDQNIKLEIRQALNQYDLVQANMRLHKEILEKNRELKKINENLERLVRERTEDLEIQNQALELSRTMLDDLPIPIIGVSAEGMVVMMNRMAQSLKMNGTNIIIGSDASRCFPEEIKTLINSAISSEECETVFDYRCLDQSYDIDLTPLSGKYRGKGIVLALRPSSKLR